jgi:AraC family transcriptional regulator
MYSKRRIPKLVSTKTIKDYIPAQVLLSSDPNKWKGFLLNLFSFPAYLEEALAPGLKDYTIGVQYNGELLGECNFNETGWKPHEVNTGKVIMYGPQQSINWHWNRLHEKHIPLKMIGIYLQPETLNKAAIEALGIDPRRIEMRTQFNAPDPFIQQLFLALKDELECDNPCGALYAETASQMLALHLLSKHCTINTKVIEYRNGLSKFMLCRVLDYIHANLSEEISLEALALLTGLSAYHFLRLFKQSTGETPLQYIIRCRMEKAKELLAQTDLSVLEISLEVGYESQHHFISLFKRFTGVTPKYYRNSMN